MIKLKKIIPVIIAILTLSLLPISVNAHPGNTDGSGGHTDRSTGEYHYHHGYSAHDHYDMDGDGDIDCPYNFDDQSDTSGGGNSDSSNTTKDKASISPVSTEPPVNSAPTVNNKKEVEEMPPWGIWTIVILGIISVVLYLMNRSKNDKIELRDKKIHGLEDTCDEFRATLKKRNDEISLLNEMEQQYRLEAIQAKKRAEGMVSIREAEIATLRKKISILQSEKDDLLQNLPLQKTAPSDHEEYEIINIPSEVYFVRGNIPVKGKVTSRKPFGDFTVFVAQRGKKYHTDPYCGGSLSLDAVHLYDVLDNKSACFRCALVYNQQHPKTAPDWYRKVKALKPNVTYSEQLTISQLQAYESR